MIISSKKLFLIFFVIFINFLAVGVYSLNLDSEYVWFFCVIINVFFLIIYRENIMLNVFFVFSFFYAIQFGSYFLNGYYLSYWMGFQTPELFNKVVLLNMLFISGVGVVNINNKENTTKFFSLFCLNYSCFIISISIALLFSVFGIDSSSITFEITKNPMYEYTLIFILMAYIFSGKKYYLFMIVNIFVIYYSFKGLFFGGRIESIQAILMFFYFNFNLAKNIKKKYYYLSILIFSFLLYVVGRIRHDWSLINDLISSPISFFSSHNYTGIVSNNFGDVIVSSSRMLGLVNSGIWDLTFRIESFFSYIFNLFLFGMDFKNYANLAAKDQNIYGAGGGGLISTYFYVWGSVFFTIAISIFIGKIISKFFTSDNKYILLYGFLVLITFPRWYAYNPINLVKMIVIAVMIYSILILIFKVKKDNL